MVFQITCVSCPERHTCPEWLKKYAKKEAPLPEPGASMDKMNKDKTPGP